MDLQNFILAKHILKNGKKINIVLSKEKETDLLYSLFGPEFGVSPFINFEDNTDNWHKYTIKAKDENNNTLGLVSVKVNRCNFSNNCYLNSGGVIKTERGQGIYSTLFHERLKFINTFIKSNLITVSTKNKKVTKILKKYNFIRNGYEVSYDIDTGLTKIPSFYLVIKDNLKFLNELENNQTLFKS